MRKTTWQTALLLAALPFLGGAAPQSFQLQVVVMDEAGTIVPDAPVYIKGSAGGQYIGGRENGGAQIFALHPGRYVVSTAMARHSSGAVERYSSHETQVEARPGEIQSLVLTLHRLDDPTPRLAYADMRRRGWQSPTK